MVPLSFENLLEFQLPIMDTTFTLTEQTQIMLDLSLKEKWNITNPAK